MRDNLCSDPCRGFVEKAVWFCRDYDYLMRTIEAYRVYMRAFECSLAERCVWGEGGNVRFMPEVIYFITEMALASDATALYGGATSSGTGGSYQSSSFLAKVIRPIYNVVFEEWYEKVDIADNGKDKKILHKDFENFLPPDVANYDDWNELFCDPKRLAESILLEDGVQFFDQEPGARFAALHRVDWAASMNRFFTKTHREVHSMWGFLASTHRIWLVTIRHD
eukprot:g7112.t2